MFLHMFRWRKDNPTTQRLAPEQWLHHVMEAFIVGSLGSWDPDNISTTSPLGIGAAYSKLFRKLSVSDVTVAQQ